MNKNQGNKMRYSIIIIASVMAASLEAKLITANQAGNVVFIRYGNKQFSVVGDPGFANLESYKFELPLPGKEKALANGIGSAARAEESPKTGGMAPKNQEAAPEPTPRNEEAPAPKPEQPALPRQEEEAPPKQEEQAPPKQEPAIPPRKEELFPPKEEAKPEAELPKKEEKNEPADVSFKLSRANALYSNRQFMSALTLVDEVIQENPNNARAWAMRGSLFEAMGDHDRATRDWGKAYEMAPEGSILRDELNIEIPRQ
jgi:tetratricopeptide (TPR) repeat protein